MNDLFDLSGSVAVVTGGAGLIGGSLCEALAEYGATVVLVDVDKATAEIVADSIDGNVVVKSVDTTSQRAVESLFEDIVDSYGSVDILVNSAYPRNENYGKRYEDVSVVDWEENIVLNLNSYYLTCHKAAEVMKKQDSGGSIVNLGSVYGVQAPDFGIYDGTDMTSPVEYSAIKGAILNFTRYLASYLGEEGIRANVLSPGGVFADQDPQFVAQYESKTPLSRMATSEDFKGAIVYLASDSSSYLTGQNIVVDGGLTIK